jgi:uncharacterized Zn-binding protein involved in type VI secretion
MPPAARISDLHLCPKVNPGPVPIPHIGGLVLGPGVSTVKIGGMVASVEGDKCMCIGPPDAVKKGSSTVKIGGKPAARMLDSTEHGGLILLGAFTVWIGG